MFLEYVAAVTFYPIVNYINVQISIILVSDTISERGRPQIRPASIGVSPPPKLISLEQARTSRNLSSVVSGLQSRKSKDVNEDVPLAQQECSPELISPDQAAFKGGSPLCPTPGNPLKPGKNYIDVGEGPDSLPEYHTVIDLPSRKKQNTTRNRKWKSLFGKRPETTKSSSGTSSLRQLPMRRRSFEDAIKKDQGTVCSKSVDEPLREAQPESGKRKGLSHNKYHPQATGTTSGRSKFYVDPDFPPEGIRGTFVKARFGSPDALLNNSSESRDGENTERTVPTRPITSPSDCRQLRSNSPGCLNRDESAFFVAGRVNHQMNTKTIEVVRSSTLKSLKGGGAPSARGENGTTKESKVSVSTQ